MSNATDYEGNTYTGVTIGGQEWINKNLYSKRLNDGTKMKLVDLSVLNADGININRDLWYKGKTPCYAYVNNNSKNMSTYGLLYNYAAVASGKLAPTGWHVGTNTEWGALVTQLSGAAAAGGALKGTGTTYWATPNTGATNSSAFTALPAGYYDDGRGFMRLGLSACFWSSTAYSTSRLDRGQAYSRVITFDSASIAQAISSISCGFSVRCLKT